MHRFLLTWPKIPLSLPLFLYYKSNYHRHPISQQLQFLLLLFVRLPQLGFPAVGPSLQPFARPFLGWPDSPSARASVHCTPLYSSGLLTTFMKPVRQSRHHFGITFAIVHVHPSIAHNSFFILSSSDLSREENVIKPQEFAKQQQKELFRAERKLEKRRWAYDEDFREYQEGQ
jgi:hypothetical protein